MTSCNVISDHHWYVSRYYKTASLSSYRAYIVIINIWSVIIVYRKWQTQYKIWAAMIVVTVWQPLHIIANFTCLNIRIYCVNLRLMTSLRLPDQLRICPLLWCRRIFVILSGLFIYHAWLYDYYIIASDNVAQPLDCSDRYHTVFMGSDMATVWRRGYIWIPARVLSLHTAALRSITFGRYIDHLYQGTLHKYSPSLLEPLHTNFRDNSIIALRNLFTTEVCTNHLHKTTVK